MAASLCHSLVRQIFGQQVDVRAFHLFMRYQPVVIFHFLKIIRKRSIGYNHLELNQANNPPLTKLLLNIFIDYQLVRKIISPTTIN